MSQAGSPQQSMPDGDQERFWQAGTQPPRPADSADSEPPPTTSAGPSPGSSWTQSLTSASTVPGPPGYSYADVPSRIIAYIIDLILLTIIGSILALLLEGLFGGLTTAATLDSAGGELNLGAFFLISIADLAVSLGYFGYFWTASRGTPGMKLLSLQIGHEVDGRSIDRGQAFIRWLILGIPSILMTFTVLVSSFLTVVIFVVAVAWLMVLLYSIAQSPTKQGLHDRYAHTILVKAGRRVA